MTLLAVAEAGMSTVDYSVVSDYTSTWMVVSALSNPSRGLRGVPGVGQQASQASIQDLLVILRVQVPVHAVVPRLSA